MRQLAKSPDGSLISDFQAALDDRAIASTVTTETNSLFIARAFFILWVDENADPVKIEQARLSVVSRPTRVSIAEGMVLCRNCQYDLRGQIADGNCPECGHPYNLVALKRCPNCKANLPSDFEICWNCNHENTPPPNPT